MSIHTEFDEAKREKTTADARFEAAQSAERALTVAGPAAGPTTGPAESGGPGNTFAFPRVYRRHRARVAVPQKEAEKREKRYEQFLDRKDETYPYSEAADAILQELGADGKAEKVDELTSAEVKTVAWVFAGGQRVGGQSDAMLRDKILGKRQWAKVKYEDRKYVQEAKAKKAKIAK